MQPSLTAGVPTVPYRSTETVERAIGRALGGLQESTVKQGLKKASPESWSRRLAIACQLLLARGEYARARDQVEELFGLFNSAPRPQLCDALLLAEAEADAELGKERARYMLDPTPANAGRYGRALLRHEARERPVTTALQDVAS